MSNFLRSAFGLVADVLASRVQVASFQYSTFSNEFSLSHNQALRKDDVENILNGLNGVCKTNGVNTSLVRSLILTLLLGFATAIGFGVANAKHDESARHNNPDEGNVVAPLIPPIAIIISALIAFTAALILGIYSNIKTRRIIPLIDSFLAQQDSWLNSLGVSHFAGMIKSDPSNRNSAKQLRVILYQRVQSSQDSAVLNISPSDLRTGVRAANIALTASRYV